MAKDTKTAEQAEQDRGALLTQAYSAATTRLRQLHLEEFNQLRVEEAKQRGVDWEPPKTAEQRALEQVEALLAQHPSLRDKVTGQPGTVTEATAVTS